MIPNVDVINSVLEGKSDSLYIASINDEERSLGIPSLLSEDYVCENCVLFQYESLIQANLDKLNSILQSHANQLHSFHLKKQDPLSSFTQFCKLLKKIKDSIDSITLDVSTFSAHHLLNLLKILDDFNLWEKLRILYTKPENYETEALMPLSFGIDEISAIGVFVGSTSPSLPILLIEFLGYEGDRAKAIYNDVDPDFTKLIIPKPAFHSSWEGKTERLNNTLIKMVDHTDLAYASSFDPIDVLNSLESISNQHSFKKLKWVVVPLGTKPQTVGIYMFWRKHPNQFSILFAEPLRMNRNFKTTGIGNSLILKPVM